MKQDAAIKFQERIATLQSSHAEREAQLLDLELRLDHLRRERFWVENQDWIEAKRRLWSRNVKTQTVDPELHTKD